MPIAALPQSTARAIGSTSVLSDACSVVKELLDNSLDANASSISIEISQNTVDLIQVKDNGRGIPSEDHSFVCKRSFTSKIQTLDDLRNVGGTSLGFRGEALASTCEMSGGVNITTRVESQVVGTSLNSERASHPVGTTVRVTDFLKHIPVRRQTAIKSASKTITRIKKLLQAYAMAQPSKRISFRVLKSKNGNGNWTYAPKPNTALREAALLVAGSETANNCTVITWSSKEVGEHETEHDTTANYKLTAFLPKADSDFTKVSSGGQYVSVDGRPVSTSRGTPRDIIKLFRTYIRSAARSKDDEASLSDPFLCLHIRCPKGSYDANIEPAKDDVLFTDSTALISLSEDLFKRVYGEVDHGATSDLGQSKTILAESKQTEDHDIQQTHGGSQASSVPGDARQSYIHHTLNNNRPNVSCNDTPTRSGHIDIRNPWAFARINTSTHSAGNARAHYANLLTPSRTQEAPGSPEPESITRSRNSGSPPLPSPSNSDSTLSSGSRRSSLFMRSSQLSPAHAAYTKSHRDIAKDRYGNGALDTWFQKITQSSFNHMSACGSSQDTQDVIIEDRGPEHSGREKYPPQGRSLEDYANDVLDNERTNISTDEINVPGISGRDSPVDDIEDIGPSEDAVHRRQEFPVLEQWSSRLHQSSAPAFSSETELALDFERRKKAVLQSRRLQTKAFLGSTAPREYEPPSSSPHQNRYLAARAALATPGTESVAEMPHSAHTTEASNPPLTSDDPRAYFIRHRNTIGKSESSSRDLKVRRVHTNKLPLERIPDGSSLHDTGLKVAMDLDHLSSSFVQICKVDSYSRSGTSSEAFADMISKPLLHLWDVRLSDLIKKNYRSVETDNEPNISLDLSAIESHAHESHN
ncbi:DNA mismatch repair protein [Paecilomyces variotii No. 5]|uniref:DNA mismatch repair protein n=1 Tax=Byssochlamys spectabilis (strain No. 5 / NBRC 109023) TaxID=1356009 RepID=V5FY20_BYSSN|nr:DNA mismatch repair protein [Paecilomyces variotii No. 5]